MTDPIDVDALLAVPVELDLSQGDAALVIRYRNALRELAKALAKARAERDAYAETFNLACRLQDADQCEDHATGDDCPQGEIEHQFYEHLSKVRTDDNRTDPIERGAKARGPAVPSPRAHVTNDADDCVSWCPACSENRSRGLNLDGTSPVATAAATTPNPTITGIAPRGNANG